MVIMSKKTERILKVYGFTGVNNTLFPPIAGASSSFILSRDIILRWIVIIIDSKPFTAKLQHVFQTYIRRTTR